LSYQKNGSVATANNRSGAVISSGTNYTQVIRTAIAATPEDGSLYIGAGTYDGLIADQNIQGIYAVFPIKAQNIRIYGAGIGNTILKLGNNQHYTGHPALIFYATGYDFYGASYSSFYSGKYDFLTATRRIKSNHLLMARDWCLPAGGEAAANFSIWN